MNTRTLRLSMLPVLLAGFASADLYYSGSLVAGYATDDSGSHLRTIWGVPGAYSFAKTAMVPDGVSRIRLAPRQAYALADLSADSSGVLFLNEGVVDRVVPVDGALVAANWTAFSPAARSAVLFSAAGHRLQVLTGLPTTPAVALNIDTSSLPEEPVLGSVGDDGALVVVASASAVYRVSSQGAQLLLSPGEVQSIAVLRNGKDAAVAGGGSVEIIANAANRPEPRVVATGLDSCSELYPSADGQSLYVALPGSSAVNSVDVAGGGLVVARVYAAPEHLTPLRNTDTFLVSAHDGQPGWIFYRDGANFRSVFIPAEKGDLQ